MISRFFKKKAKPSPSKAEPKKKATPSERSSSSPKLLTAEGWKRLMMRKSGK